MSQVTESGQSARSPQPTAITIELVEANETPAVVIIRWPAKASVLHLRLILGSTCTNDVALPPHW